MEGNHPRRGLGSARPDFLHGDARIRCAGCEPIPGDDARDHPLPVGDDPALHERVGHFLKGLADLLALLVGKLNEYGDALIAFAKNDAATRTAGDDQ
jgi:glycine/D-amino acid oxidase-like deaminating enzyme